MKFIYLICYFISKPTLEPERKGKRWLRKERFNSEVRCAPTIFQGFLLDFGNCEDRQVPCDSGLQARLFARRGNEVLLSPSDGELSCGGGVMYNPGQIVLPI